LTPVSERAILIGVHEDSLAPRQRSIMPILRDIPVELTLEGVVRAQGMKDVSRLRGPMASTLDELMEMVQTGDLLETAVAYESYTVAEITDSHLKVEGSDAVLHGSVFSHLIADAQELTALVCTAGPKIEKRAAEYFDQGESLRGLFLDGIGSAAVGALGSRACSIISKAAEERGLHTGSPISPGGPRFTVAEQWPLFRLAPADEIGVRLSDSGLMIPRKSISMVIGIGEKMPTWTHAESCDHCNLGHTCPYRARAASTG
jgi:hypothetical protein